MKPLFFALKTVWFRAFESGTKTIEYRRYGARWHERSCAIGRAVVLSHGYSGARLYGRVAAFNAMPMHSEIYGECMHAAIEIALDSTPDQIKGTSLPSEQGIALAP